MCMGKPISKTALKQLKAETRKRGAQGGANAIPGGYIRIYKIVGKRRFFLQWSSVFGYVPINLGFKWQTNIGQGLFLVSPAGMALGTEEVRTNSNIRGRLFFPV